MLSELVVIILLEIAIPSVFDCQANLRFCLLMVCRQRNH